MSSRLQEIAESTIAISQCGFYSVGDEVFDIETQIKACLDDTAIIRRFETCPASPESTCISVVNNDTLSAANELGAQTVILNFASAKNPGGGFERGSLAQEEDIAYRSCLHASLASKMDFYHYNRNNLNKGLYCDDVIYSPGLVVFRDTKYNTIPWWTCNCITSPAVNRSATLRQQVSEDVVDATMLRRIRHIITVAVEKQNKDVVLGAYGCGVFKNDPYKVAQHFHRVLIEEGMGGYFDNIVFAIKGDGKNLRTFKSVFGG